MVQDNRSRHLPQVQQVARQRLQKLFQKQWYLMFPVHLSCPSFQVVRLVHWDPVDQQVQQGQRGLLVPVPRVIQEHQVLLQVQLHQLILVLRLYRLIQELQLVQVLHLYLVLQLDQVLQQVQQVRGLRRYHELQEHHPIP